jgi:hypothetical protein
METKWSAYNILCPFLVSVSRQLEWRSFCWGNCQIWAETFTLRLMKPPLHHVNTLHASQGTSPARWSCLVALVLGGTTSLTGANAALVKSDLGVDGLGGLDNLAPRGQTTALVVARAGNA